MNKSLIFVSIVLVVFVGFLGWLFFYMVSHTYNVLGFWDIRTWLTTTGLAYCYVSLLVELWKQGTKK